MDRRLVGEFAVDPAPSEKFRARQMTIPIASALAALQCYRSLFHRHKGCLPGPIPVRSLPWRWLPV